MSRYRWPTEGGEEKDDAPGARARFMLRRRTEFDPEGALAAARSTPSARPASRAPVNGRTHLWQPLGPLTVVGGQAAGGPRISGRINALAVHPAGQRLYAASGNGGVWYSSDGGSLWRSLAGLASTNVAGITRPAQRNTCHAVTVDWGLTEAADVVWVGTGEVTGVNDAQPGSSLGGVGILRADNPATSADVDPWKREANNLIGLGVYKIAREPGGSGVVAAASDGLWVRPPAGGPDVPWVRPAGTPFDTLTVDCTDVLWTAAHGAAPARLWVWVKTGANAGLWVRETSGATPPVNFTAVAINGAGAYVARRAALAAVSPTAPANPPIPSQPQTQVWVLNDAGQNVPALLFRVGNGDATAPQATRVAGVPNLLKTQGHYDIAIDVHPAAPDRVVLGGCFLATVTKEGVRLAQEGAIVLGDVALKAGKLTFGHPTAFQMIGIGVHADIHGVYYTRAGVKLYTCCDGGVFRSDRPANVAGFYAINNGLQVVESNYLTQHAQCEGFVAAGLQDNASIQRHSSSVWTRVPRASGDGGGILFRPLHPQHLVYQYIQANWSSADGVMSDPDMLTRKTNNGKTVHNAAESKASAFYSSAAGITALRTPPAPGVARDVGQLIFGTTRVWYTEETRLKNLSAKETAIGRKWFTLPGGTDPLPGDTVAATDNFTQPITVCRWQSPDVAWILGESKLARFERTAGSDAGGPPGTWSALSRTIILRATTATALANALVWTDVAVNLGPPAAAGQPAQPIGADGAVYLGTIGHPTLANVDTLWWYDGAGNWHPTGLRNDPKGVPAPVTAIACDPAFPNEVYVGTTVGVWTGVRTHLPPAAPTWAWDARLNGLPEAAVEDLLIFSDGGVRLLRAGIAARGVWELRLDQSDLDSATYLRSHDNDMRYRVRAHDKQRDSRTLRSWHGSPDVRPRMAPALVPKPNNLPWSRTKLDAARLRRFQTAFAASLAAAGTPDPRIRANGLWDAYFSEVLRDHVAPIQSVPQPGTKPALAVPRIDATFWDAYMKAPHASAEPWGAGVPSEADLIELTPALSEGDIKRTSCSLPRKPCKVEVVVHHRGLDARAGSDVRVVLLQWLDPKTKKAAKWNDSSTWFSGNVPWAGAVEDVLNDPAGATSKNFADGWSFVGDATTRRKDLGTQIIDALHPGVASFDLDLSAVKKDAVLLLVAVIRASNNIALAQASLQELAMTNAFVAVRSVRVAA